MKYDLTCQICGATFQNSYKDVKICNNCKNRPCEICGKPFVHEWPYDQKACSAKCRHLLRTDPNNNAQKEEKKRKTLQERYGVDNVSHLDEVKKKISESHKSEEFKAKVRKTSLEKYGVEHYQQAPEYIAKRNKTIMERYGVKNVSELDYVRKKISERLQDPEVREKYMQTSIEHYGFYPPGKDPEVRRKAEATTMERYGVPYLVMLPRIRSAQAKNQVSIPNRTFAEILNNTYELDTEFEFLLGKKLYDIHILNSNILIEIDPSYTHSNLPNHWCSGLPKNYHLDKTLLAEENGYRCIHVFDWDNMERIAKMLQPKERVYARNCTLVQLDAKQAKEFISANHLQGDAKGAKYCYGLKYKDELVSAMTFGRPRYNQKYQWELLRLCTLPEKSIIGSASKMLKQFIEDADPESIISYCDKSKFSGEVYTKLGFKLHHASPPAKVWSKGTERITDNLLRQRGYDQLFGTDYGKGTSNEELMIQNKWLSVYDCGQLVFEWIKN